MRRFALLVAGLALLAGVAAAVSGGGTQAQARWVITDLGTLGGAESEASTESQARPGFAHARGKIAYAASSGVCVVDADGRHRRCLARGGYSPVWSSDGRRIAFETEVDDPTVPGGRMLVFVIRLDGRGLMKLTPEGASDEAPTWSPSTTRIALARRSGGSVPGVYIVNVDGTDPRLLARNATAPSWSPAGAKIAFVRPGRGLGFDADSSGDVYVVNADGSSTRRLTREGDFSHPLWSPSGLLLLVQRDSPKGATDLYVMKPDGTDLRRLTTSTQDDWGGSWSPDSRKIAYTCNGKEISNVCVVNAAGAGQRRLTSKRPYNQYPTWSPNGRWIAFESYPNEDALPGIYVMNSDGSGAQRIVGDVFDEPPAWQPSPKT